MVWVPQCKGWKDPCEWKLPHIHQLLVYADRHLQGKTAWLLIYKLLTTRSAFCFMLSDRFIFVSLWLLPTHLWQIWRPYSDTWLHGIFSLGIRVNKIKLFQKHKSSGKMPVQKETDKSRQLIKHWKNYHVKQAMNCTRTHEPWLGMENKYFQKELEQRRSVRTSLQDTSCPSSFLMHTIVLNWPVSFWLVGVFGFCFKKEITRRQFWI